MDVAEQHNRVLILPKDVLRAERYARSKNSMSSAIIILTRTSKAVSVAVRSGSRAAGLELYYRFDLKRQSR